MKICTYYENINGPHFKEQDNLLDLWKSSWESEGFEVIILGIDDAKKSPIYEDFCEKMRYIFHETTGKNLGHYGLSCFLRWLAYSTLENQDEQILVSDYDVINTGLWKTWHPLTNKLHFLDSFCPCMASGSPRQFKVLCDAFFEVTMDRLGTLKSTVNHYHDQDFFAHNFSPRNNPESKSLWIKYGFYFDRSKDAVCPYDNKYDNTRAFHVSHRNCDVFKNKFPKEAGDLSLDEIRLYICRKILKNKEESEVKLNNQANIYGGWKMLKN